jgi:Tfp pilus assembly protein PilF
MDDNAFARKIATGIWTAQRDNAEINILLGLLYVQKIQIDGSQNSQPDQDVISQSIVKAETHSVNNPRLTVLQAKIKEKSGDQQNADILYRKALNEFSNPNSSDSKSPTWGKQLVPSVQ